MRFFLKYWLPVLLWMGIIFSASNDRQSWQHSSRIIEPVLRWLCPHISPTALRQVSLGLRKCAHLTEYALLALLVWRALRHRMRPPAALPQPASPPPARKQPEPAETATATVTTATVTTAATATSATAPQKERAFFSWPIALGTILVVALYASTDEIHQAFVPTRQASMLDVCIDTSGALLALICVWLVGRWRQRRN